MAQTQRIIISLPAELLIDLDEYVKKNKYNRSECIRHAIRDLIQDKTNVQKSV